MKRAVLTAAVVAVLTLACGGSGSSGGSGDDGLRLSNAQGAISADADWIDACQQEGFPNAYVFTANYKGDLRVGDEVFQTLIFLPSGATNSFSGFLDQAGPGSGIAPDEVRVGGCYIAPTDTRLKVSIFIVTADGVRSNTVSDTFNI